MQTTMMLRLQDAASYNVNVSNEATNSAVEDDYSSDNSTASVIVVSPPDQL